MKCRLILILLAVFFAGCNGKPAADTANNAGDLTVSAAVSLKEAFIEIGDLYQSGTGQKISFNFGASGALQKQIENGAPVDVFASAGAAQMDQLGGKNLVDAGTRKDFARNTLVLIVPQDSKLNIKSFTDLSSAAVKKIAAGNPKTVPAGQYTEQVFHSQNLQSLLRPKLIFAEDVRQVLDYVARGEADAGVVYATDVRSVGEKVRVAAAAPQGSHSPVLYPIAVIKDARQPKAAQAFIDLVVSAEGQAILRKYGFAPVADK